MTSFLDQRLHPTIVVVKKTGQRVNDLKVRHRNRKGNVCIQLQTGGGELFVCPTKITIVSKEKKCSLIEICGA